MSSRVLTASETGLVVLPIAMDGIVIIVNRRNPVNALSVEQVRAIFSGEIRDWSELGGPRRRITVITREDGSGTRASFEERIMYGDDEAPAAFARDALVQDSNGAVREIVAGDPGAIGYISYGLVDGRVRAVTLDRVVPSEATIRSGAYPVTRKFLFLTRPETDSCASRFIYYVVSPAGQQVLVEEGLVSVMP
jgi:phosphate transport system substrate-binding protein